MCESAGPETFTLKSYACTRYVGVLPCRWDYLDGLTDNALEVETRFLKDFRNRVKAIQFFDAFGKDERLAAYRLPVLLKARGGVPFCFACFVCHFTPRAHDQRVTGT